MGDPYTEALEAALRANRAEIASLRERLDDEAGMKRGYRRLLIEALRRSAHCPLCNPRPYDAN